LWGCGEDERVISERAFDRIKRSNNLIN